MNGLSVTQVCLLLSFSGVMAAGQILFKRVALSLTGDQLTALLLQCLSSGAAWAALALYGFATALWVYLLRTVPLSIAYPFLALGFIIVPVAAYFAFSEPLTLRFAFGTAFIVLGLYLTSGS